MPSKHSKNSGDRAHYSHKEKKAAKVGSQSQRLGTDSQLPFGYCPLNLNPIEDAVVTPSGRLYSREAILEYILNKMREIKEQEAAIAKEQQEREREEADQEANAKILLLKSFQESQVGVDDVVVGHKKRLQVEAEDTHNSYAQSRQRLIDDTDEETKLASLQMVSPWVPQFTPSAPAARPKAPPKRPPSPFSGQPLRTKDLIPVNLMKEISGDKSGPQRFVCPVSRKTITTQKVVLIKSTGTLLLESSALETCFRNLRDPLTNKSFTMEDVIELVPASSGFASSGTVNAKKYRPSFN